jgi:hypothetical protein
MTHYMSRQTAMLSPLTEDELRELNGKLRRAYNALETTPAWDHRPADETATEISLIRGYEVYPELAKRTGLAA